jgi:hypothetical protein
MRTSKHGLALLTVILLPLRASAGEPEAKAQETSQQRVHVGSASVTVIDEHEAVDDVITRIRTGRTEPTTDKAKEPGKQPPSRQPAVAASTVNANKDSGRASLKVARDRTTAGPDNERRKEERRERAATARTHTEQKRR